MRRARGDLRNRELAPETVWTRARSHTDHRQKDRPSYRVDLGGSLSFTFLGHIAAVFGPSRSALELCLVLDTAVRCPELSGDF